jgi:hypothetical protein
MALPADSTVENRRLLGEFQKPQLYPLFQLQSIVEKNTPSGRSTERRVVPERLVVPILLLPSCSFRLDTQNSTNSPNYTKMQHTHTHTHTPAQLPPPCQTQKTKNQNSILQITQQKIPRIV